MRHAALILGTHNLTCMAALQKVRSFVESMGNKMDYRVATDDAGSAQAYMDHYGVGVRTLNHSTSECTD